MIDFAGTSPQVESSLNAVFAVIYSAVYYVFRCLLPEDAHAPVAGGNVETSQRIVDVLLRALPKPCLSAFPPPAPAP